MTPKGGRSRLDIPANREAIYARLREQCGIEANVWEVVGVSKVFYYRYRSAHPDFAAKIQEVIEECKTVRPEDSEDIRQIIKKHVAEWYKGGCKSKRYRREFTPIPKLLPNGEPERNAKGERQYDLILKGVTEDTYDNGIRADILERVFPSASMTDKTLKLFIASAYKDLQEHLADPTEREAVAKWLRDFSARAELELAVSKAR